MHFGPQTRLLLLWYRPLYKNLPSQKHQKNLTLSVIMKAQEPIFPVSNTEFEGGGDGHGCGDRTFLVK
jgi:hypothetical protein